MGFKIIVRKNGVQHGESHYTSEAVAAGMAKKMRNAGADVTLARCNGACCSGAQSNPRRNGSLSAARARLLAAQEAYALLRSHHGGSMIGWAEYTRPVAGMSPAAILAEARENTKSNPRRTKQPPVWEREGHSQRNPRRNGNTDDADLLEGVLADFARLAKEEKEASKARARRSYSPHTKEALARAAMLDMDAPRRRNGTTAANLAASRSLVHRAGLSRNPASPLTFESQGGTLQGGTSWWINLGDSAIGELSRERGRGSATSGMKQFYRQADAPYEWHAEINGTHLTIPVGSTLTEAKNIVRAAYAGMNRPNPRARKNPSMDAETASTLIKQLGGSGKLVAMVGAKDFMRTERNGHPALSFKFKGSTKANYVNIALDPSDTYTLQFGKIVKYDLKPTGEFHGIYADQLKRTFEKFTGLYLSL